MDAYSLDLRKRIVEAKRRGTPTTEVVGLGAEPGQPSWGSMLFQAQSYLTTAWWMAFFPGMAIFFAVLGFNLLGDGVREALDPRTYD